MPVIKGYTSDRYGTTYDSYVSGPSISRHDTYMARKTHPKAFAWVHDSLLPPVQHLLWLLPLHGFWALAAYGAYSANTVTGRTFLLTLYVALTVPVVVFWLHIYVNTATMHFLRRHIVIHGHIHKDGSRNEWTDEIWSIIYGTTYPTNRPKNFEEWLDKQLHAQAPYFTQVQPIVDEYLEVTAYARKLQKALRAKNEVWSDDGLRDKIDEAGDIAFMQLRPIYNNAMEIERREKEEREERQARETAFVENEDRRLTQQRIAMASDNIDRYTQGYQALLPDLEET